MAPQALNPIPSLLEFDMTENRLRDGIGTGADYAPLTGYVDVPQAPGLGIEIDRDVLEQYA